MGTRGGGMGGTGGGMDENDDTAWVLISGGATTVNAGGDGVDSNGDLTITGGQTYVSGPTDAANGALDYEGTGTISGGVLVAAGSAGMAQNMGSDSTQASLLVAATGDAGDTITLADSSGTVLASFSPATSYQCAVISAPDIEVGQTYTLTSGSTTTEVTPDSVVYSSADAAAGGMGMGGGMQGGTQMDGTMPDADGQAPTGTTAAQTSTTA
nr:hypothetical protein [Thermophilibacter immobilis]